jgi:hypothetical protein
MRPLPPTNAQLRVQYKPFRTWLVLIAISIPISIARDLVYGIPMFPIGQSLFALIANFVVGALYFLSIEVWFFVRKRNADYP